MMSLRNDLPDLYYKLLSTGACDVQLKTKMLALLQQQMGGSMDVIVGVSAEKGGTLDNLKVATKSPTPGGFLGAMQIGSVAVDLFANPVPFEWANKKANLLDVVIFVGTKG
ncbi:MAG: hypothetical protein WAN75_15915, partial [Xanthobacteraceae bacterium]